MADFDAVRTHLFRRHFPSASDFRVLALCPSPAWRDALRREMKDKPGADVWLFASQTDLRADAVLHGPVWSKLDREGLSLVPAPTPEPTPAAEVEAGAPAEARV